MEPTRKKLVLPHKVLNDDKGNGHSSIGWPFLLIKIAEQHKIMPDEIRISSNGRFLYFITF